MGQKEFFMVDLYLKGGPDTLPKYKCFSGRFENVSELKGFLRFARHFTGGNTALNLGIAFKSWREIARKKGEHVTKEEIIARMRAIREEVKGDFDLARRKWSEYRSFEKKLMEMDPENPELKIGIHGLPYFAGMKD